MALIAPLGRRKNFAGLGRYRRLAKDFKATIASAVAALGRCCVGRQAKTDIAQDGQGHSHDSEKQYRTS
jgi:hypothetical protein